MTSRTGSNKGFTLIEVLVTVVILSVGIIPIFQVFMISLNTMRHLTNRIYATTILDNRIVEIEQDFRTRRVISLYQGRIPSAEVRYRKNPFQQKMKVGQVGASKNLMKLDLSLVWNEGLRSVQLSRSAYISNFGESYE